MYAALPKIACGALEPSVVRCARHHYFLHKRGWHMKGAQQSASNSSDSSSPAGVLRDHVPEYVQGLLQERMESQDWRLHELALCAAAISQVIHEEVMADLRFVFSTVLQFSTTSDLNEHEYESVVIGMIGEALHRFRRVRRECSSPEWQLSCWRSCTATALSKMSNAMPRLTCL